MITSFRLLLVFVVVLGAVCPAAAQSQQPAPTRPYRGLFGGAQPMTSRAQSLDLSLSGFGGWDQPSTEAAAPGAAGADRVDVSGVFSGGSASLDYNHPGEKLQVNGFGTGFAGYFPGNADPWYTSSAGGGGVTYHFLLGRRNRMQLGQDGLFATDYRIGVMGGTPGSDIPLSDGNSGFNNSLQRDPQISTTSNAELSHDFSQVSSLNFSFGFRYSHFFSNDTERSDQRGEQAGIQYRRRMSKNATLHLGYTYNHTFVEAGTNDVPSTFHNIDAGVDYNRSFSLTRRTTFSFNTGSVVAASANAGDDAAAFSSPHFFVVGGAGLVREFGHTWSANINYSRSVGYQVGFNQPTLLDTAFAGVGGLIGRRVDVSSGLSYSTGKIGLETSNYRSWYASSQVRYAIYRSLAAYASYYYYLYNFGNDVTLPTGTVRALDRNGVRVGVTAWLPLWYSRGVK